MSLEAGIWLKKNGTDTSPVLKDTFSMGFSSKAYFLLAGVFIAIPLPEFGLVGLQRDFPSINESLGELVGTHVEGVSFTDEKSGTLAFGQGPIAVINTQDLCGVPRDHL